MTQEIKDLLRCLKEYCTLSYKRIVLRKEGKDSIEEEQWLSNKIRVYSTKNSLTIFENLCDGKYYISLTNKVGKVVAKAEYGEDRDSLLKQGLLILFKGMPYRIDYGSLIMSNGWLNLEDKDKTTDCLYIGKTSTGLIIKYKDGRDAYSDFKWALNSDDLIKGFYKLFAVFGVNVLQVSLYKKYRKVNWHIGRISV